MKQVEFNVPPNPFDVPEFEDNIRYNVSKDDYHLINAFRGKATELGYFRPIDATFGEVLRIYRAGGIESLKKILHEKPYLLGTLRDKTGRWPDGIYSLIDCFVEELNPKRIYEVDVAAKSWLVNQGRENRYGNIKDKNLRDLLVDFYGISASIQLGDITEVDHSNYYKAIDLVIAFVPWVENQDLTTILSEAEKLLSERGKVLLLSREAAFAEDTKAVLENINLHVNTVINFPAEVFHPKQGSLEKKEKSTELIILSRKNEEFIFTGQFANEAPHNEELLRNLFAGREQGRIPELGCLTHHRRYLGCLNVINGVKFKEKAKLQRHSGVRLNSLLKPGAVIASEVLNSFYSNKYDGDLDALFMHESDLSLLSDKKVEEMVGEWQFASTDVIKLPLDQTKVFYPFFRAYWRAPLHQLALNSLPKSVHFFLFWDSVQKEHVENLTVYLPPFSEQVRRFELIEAIGRMKKEAEQLQDGIWSGELTLNEFSARVNALQSGDNLSYWVAQLPSPLARILNRYVTSSEVRARSEHLYHFFEACAEYVVCTSISFLRQPPVDYQAIAASFKISSRSDSRRQIGATFGTWTHLFSEVVASIRTLLKGKVLTSSIFPQELITLVLNPDFSNTLENARILRNKRSHSGLMGDEEAKNRLKELEALMQGIRHELVGAFSSSSLLYLVESKRKKNKYYIQFHDCRGASHRLSSREIEHQIDLQDGLHLSFKGQIIPLLPLVQYEEELGIFTFFNALNENEVTSVNYAHGEYSSQTVTDEVLSTLIAEVIGLDI